MRYNEENMGNIDYIVLEYKDALQAKIDANKAYIDAGSAIRKARQRLKLAREALFNYEHDLEQDNERN